MQTIPIVLAEPGMTLDEDILPPDKPNGIPILGKGNELTRQVIERLKNMGIQSITVAGHPVTIPGEETREQALTSIETRFNAVKDDPYMMDILELFKKQINRSYGKTS